MNLCGNVETTILISKKYGVNSAAKTPLTERLEMTKVGEIYFCEICGNKVEVVEAGAGALVCCGKPMKLVKA